jgi:hypothetical protein
MTTTIWTPTLAWLAAATAALVLAVAAPSETNLMGRLPTITAKRLDAQRVEQARTVPAERTLALVGFDRSHRGEIHSWIQGLQLDRDSAISWVKMPVLNDPGSEDARLEAERRLLASLSPGPHIGRVVPVFTNRDEFIRAAGISGTQHASVLVLDRDGQVLARAEGHFDQNRAQALRETLLASAPAQSSFSPGR